MHVRPLSKIRSYVQDTSFKTQESYRPGAFFRLRPASFVISFLFIILNLAFMPSGHAQGWIENRSYDTPCAEVDNINIPLFFTNATSYRITATHPWYYPVAIDERGPDFEDCDFTDRGIWIIGTNNNSSAEFLQTVTEPSYTYYALDNPPAGTDQPWSSFPKEINVDTTPDHYIHFTAAESGDANTELTIGATLTIKLVALVTNVQLQARTWNGTGWTDHGSKTFSPSAMTHTWSFPDFTWVEGVDSNIVHLQATHIPGASNEWAVYDYLELRKRDETGPTEYTLYDDGKVKVQAVHIDFWWRAPQAMRIGVLGGATNNNSHYLRISRKEPTLSGYNEIFVLYEDGNARIIPFPPESLPWVPYGASVILGPTVEGDRPVAPINTLTVDPNDLRVDIGYEDGATARVEMYVDRERNVVDVSGITYNTETQSFARLRSMWVHDGKSDLDRVASRDGVHPISRGWDTLAGSWWRFFREVPSYHNTYCPDFAVEVLDPSLTFLSREAESLNSGSGYTLSARSAASGGMVASVSAAGGEANFNISLNRLYPETSLLLHYSDANGGDNGTNLGNRIDLYVNGSWTAHTYSANTGGSNSFEIAPTLRVGDLLPGDHTLRLVIGAGTGGMDLDRIELVSRPTILQITNNVLTRQGESVNSGSGYSFSNRANAVNHTSLVMSATGGTAHYVFSLPSTQSNLYLRVRHSDDWNATRLEVRVNGVLAAKTPSMTEGTLNVNNAGFEDGPSAGGTPTGWFKDGNCGQEGWAGENSPQGIAFNGWAMNAAGYFGQEVYADSQYGDVFSFAIRGRLEPPFYSSSGTVRLKIEFWVRGEGAARAVAIQNVYAQLTNAPNAWQLLRVRATNAFPEVNLVKIVADFADSPNSGGVITWDHAQLFQCRGSGSDYFVNAGMLFLGNLSSGTHTVTLTSAAETLGMEVDEMELFTLARSNRAPVILAPAGFILPVGVSTSFTVHLLEYDPDPAWVAVALGPANYSFDGEIFSWTAGADFAGRTGVVMFTSSDEQGTANSTSSSNVNIVVPYDWDEDLMGDGWEWTHFGTLTNTGTGDFDEDGFSDLAEHIANTLPKDPYSFFALGPIGQDVEGRIISVSTAPGRQYTIRYADALGIAWLPFANPAMGTWLETGQVNRVHFFVDNDGPDTTLSAPADGTRFYHIDVSLP